MMETVCFDEDSMLPERGRTWFRQSRGHQTSKWVTRSMISLENTIMNGIIRTHLSCIVCACLLGCRTTDSLQDNLIGKWRSIKIVDPDELGPEACEIEFKAGGTFHERANEGFGIAEQYDGEYRTEGQILYLKPAWRADFLPYTYELERNTLILRDPEFVGWILELERNEKPLKELQALPKQPKNLQEAVETLLGILPSESIDEIKKMKEADLIGTHFGLGLYIRNGFGLWRDNYALLESCGGRDMHPDAASGVIIHALWKSLRKQ